MGNNAHITTMCNKIPAVNKMYDYKDTLKNVITGSCENAK